MAASSQRRNATVLVLAYLALNAVLFSMQLWGHNEVSRFLHAHATIGSAADLQAYQQMVARQMYVALAYLPLGMVWLAWSIYLCLSFGRNGAYAIVVVVGILLPLSHSDERLERMARALPCDAALCATYHAIGASWQHRALPDFPTQALQRKE